MQRDVAVREVRAVLAAIRGPADAPLAVAALERAVHRDHALAVRDAEAGMALLEPAELDDAVAAGDHQVLEPHAALVVLERHARALEGADEGVWLGAPFDVEEAQRHVAAGVQVADGEVLDPRMHVALADDGQRLARDDRGLVALGVRAHEDHVAVGGGCDRVLELREVRAAVTGDDVGGLCEDRWTEHQGQNRGLDQGRYAVDPAVPAGMCHGGSPGRERAIRIAG
ncbi:MAG: hypothetical protein ACYTG2_13885 [Planctomycetota bacterium]